MSDYDDPDLDATDAAHPAWWRGHDHTAAVFCQLVNEILDGKASGGTANEPWESTRQRLSNLVSELASLRAGIAAAKELLAATRALGRKNAGLIKAKAMQAILNLIEQEA